MVEAGMEVGGEEDEDTAELMTKVGGDGVMVGGVQAIREATEGANMEDLGIGREAGAELEDEGTRVIGEGLARGDGRVGGCTKGEVVGYDDPMLWHGRRRVVVDDISYGEDALVYHDIWEVGMVAGRREEV